MAYGLPPMNRSPLTIRCLFAALGCAGALAFSAGAAADDGQVSLAPREGVVLLTNGELLAGTIIPAGDRYDVHLETGEIRIRRSMVVMVCRDAHEVYVRKREGIELGRAADHLELAEWCLRNNLLEDSQRELTAARTADAAHPKLQLLETRLEMAKRPPPDPSESDTAEAEGAASSHAASGKPGRSTPRSRISPGAMEAYTLTIQPLLLNYCAKGGCHTGSKAAAFELERIHPRRISRSATQRNLERVLKLIDRENPRLSPILQVPAQPHGNPPTAVFTERDRAQYSQLTSWVYAVSRTRQLPQPSAPAASPPAVDLAVVPASASEPVAPAELPAVSEDAVPQDGAPASAARELTPAEKAYTPEQLRAMGMLPEAGGQVQVGADVPAAFTPKDPFDPAIFNRRFFGPAKP